MRTESSQTSLPFRRLAPPLRRSSLRDSARDRVLILTSGLGHGHVRAAQAVEAALLQRSTDVQIIDLWSLMNPGAASIVHRTYLRLVQEYPDLYERLYQLDERTWRQILESEAGPPPHVLEVLELISEIAAGTDAEAKSGGQYATDRLLLSMLYTSLPYNGSSLAGNGVRARLAIMKWSWLRLSKRLESVVAAYAPDVIVSTQMIPAAMISALKRRGRVRAPLIGVLTDYGVHDFWRQRGIDRYCIAHPTIAVPQEDSSQAVATGVPLMPAFAAPLSQVEAKRQLSLDPQRSYALILGGGLGLSVDGIAARLLEHPSKCSFIVMPGKNGGVRQALSRHLVRDGQKPDERMRIFDWTDRMDVFIRAADIVVGKPGGVSVTEVLACGRPLLATRSLGGQEGFNVRFLEQHRVGALVPDTELAARIETMMGDAHALTEMQQRAWSLGIRDGASKIAEMTLDLIARQRYQVVRESQ
jgi:UDP-N-acetylglucosamine:LPS N-acetylglucosamine transferase